MGELQFGLRKEKVIKIIGEPDKKYKEATDLSQNAEVWDYNDIGLSIRFEGDELKILNSMSIISSYYEYNGVSLIGKDLGEIREVLKEVDYEILYYKSSEEKKLIFSKELSLIVLFDYDIATSISWDPSKIGSSYSLKLKQLNAAKGSVKSRDEKLQRITYKGEKTPFTISDEYKRIKKKYSDQKKKEDDFDAPHWLKNMLSLALILMFGGLAFVIYQSMGLGPGVYLFGGIAIFYFLLLVFFNVFRKRG